MIVGWSIAIDSAFPVAWVRCERLKPLCEDFDGLTQRLLVKIVDRTRTIGAPVRVTPYRADGVNDIAFPGFNRLDLHVGVFVVDPVFCARYVAFIGVVSPIVCWVRHRLIIHSW